MFGKTVFVLAFLALFLIAGCSQEQADTARENAGERVEGVKEGVAGVVETAGYAFNMLQLATEDCEDVVAMSMREGEGYGVPGVSGAARWGIPETAPAEPRVRRSWSTLSDAEKKQVVDGFVRLKQTTVGSGAPGAERADYETFCDGEEAYAHNLHDFYVELHGSAFISMGRDDLAMTQMAHMGPQFLPWHRYVLLRIETDLREVLGDPDFALPYWDWEICDAGNDDGSNPCPELFDTEFLGSHGGCEDATVTGYLVDQGFQANLWSQVDETNIFNIDGLHCGEKPLQRAVGCGWPGLPGEPPTAEDAAGIFDRAVYDAEPYDSCNTDQDVSMRQYIEGFTDSDRSVLCVLGGCENHGSGHYYIGGDMGGQTTPNDPVFFLHHANVDRLWAMWQDQNRTAADTAVDYGNPGYPDDWRGSLFNFSEVRADEMFDFRALGFSYDTNEEG